MVIQLTTTSNTATAPLVSIVKSTEGIYDEVWVISGAYYMPDAEFEAYMIPPEGHEQKGKV